MIEASIQKIEHTLALVKAVFDTNPEPMAVLDEQGKVVIANEGFARLGERKAGVPESVIMAITGHSTREMFDRYNTVDMEDTKNAVNSLKVFFRNATQNVTLNEK